MAKSDQDRQDSYIKLRTIQCLEQLAAQMGIAGANANSVMDMISNQEKVFQSQQSNLSEQQKEEVQKKVSLLKSDLGVLLNFTKQVQIDLFDIILSLDKKEDELNNPLVFDPKAIEWMEKFSERISSFLPKRDKPVLPAGNFLGVNLYLAKTFAKEAQLVFGSFLGENQNLLKYDSIKMMATYLEKLENLLLLISRWANLALDQKEFLWTEPQQKTAEVKPDEKKTITSKPEEKTLI